MSEPLERGFVFGLRSVASAAVGGLIFGVGKLIRHKGMVDAGRRLMHSHAFERRWIADPVERERHESVLAGRLGLQAASLARVSIAEAAQRLGVTVSTVRRRVRRGELEGVYEGRRLTGIVLKGD